MKKQLIILLMVLALGSVNAQKVYKWVDENGNVHYSSTKPVKDNVETIKLKPPKVIKKKEQPKAELNESAEAESQTEKKEPLDPKAKRKASRQKAAVDAKERQRKCTMARKNLSSLSSSTRVATKGENGERRMLSDKERVEAFRNANKIIKQSCK